MFYKMQTTSGNKTFLTYQSKTLFYKKFPIYSASKNPQSDP
ncbi:hypothetical protein LEP1GSC116_3364 [Leptospira interrogans serovar Icterohaemorrhagiae str. Verdun HP]|uniref:Uncharacterized protein n=1 Tax=Leptospira interrogans serovar Icterohaemorrhagiae str. Verdun HP TaxID=1049910 RepID=M6R9Z3_LEPIR|nr:hypothetical protein LEP1GSC116_3364 [Leptospira interrogans serovar Icterohaemorrhagiae str. Verdun HP]